MSRFWSLTDEGDGEGHQREQGSVRMEGYTASPCPWPRLSAARDVSCSLFLQGLGESSGSGPDTHFFIVDRCLQARSQEIGSERNDLATGGFSSVLRNNRVEEGKKEGRIGQLEKLS